MQDPDALAACDGRLDVARSLQLLGDVAVEHRDRDAVRQQHQAGFRYARHVATLHFIYGWPCAGKTTLARALGERERAVVFCEDEWLATLATEPITTLQQYVESAARIRRLIAPLATRLLALDVSVVFDFAGNTPSHRAWVKRIADATNADHLLHVLDVPADECKRRLHERNATKPDGLYFGHISDELFDAVVPHIVPPRGDEAIRIASASDPGRWPGR